MLVLCPRPFCTHPSECHCVTYLYLCTPAPAYLGILCTFVLPITCQPCRLLPNLVPFMTALEGACRELELELITVCSNVKQAIRAAHTHAMLVTICSNVLQAIRALSCC